MNIAGTRIDNIVLGNNDVVTCKFINTTVRVDPLMSVVKTASPASMSEPRRRGDVFRRRDQRLTAHRTGHNAIR
ncbi:MAG: hypothetical protein R2851_04540 [Caldilineaceae bacterium]